jgi:biopolymer transport protein ExbD
MSASVSGPSGGKHGGKEEEPIDLDMTPMMNMLIILISFLVTMVVFTHLAVIQFELPSSAEGGAEGEAPAETAPETDLTLVVSEGGFQIIGEGKKQDPIPKTREGYDYTGLGKALAVLRAQYPAARSMVLLIEPDVLYEDIVATMDICRERRFPDVLLSGGFEG